METTACAGYRPVGGAPPASSPVPVSGRTTPFGETIKSGNVNVKVNLNGNAKRTLAVAVLACSVSACVGPEAELIDRYLDASQRGDNATVGQLSMVAFPEPVESWNLLELSEERRHPYQVPALVEAVRAAEDGRDAQFKVFDRFRQDNYETLRTIQARIREEPDYRFSGRLGELQAQWDDYRVERRAVVATLHDAEIALEQEIRRVNKSLQRESTPEYLTGETRHKEARVRVTTPSGDSQFVITVTLYELLNQFDARVPARWIITNLAEGD